MAKMGRVKDVGEFGLIDFISGQIRTERSVIEGIGDDAAVVRFTGDRYLLITTDMLIENVHFTRRMNPELIGRKALCCNISDIAAMGGIPKHAVISVGLPANLPLSFINRIYQGMRGAAKEFKVNIVGGDTNTSKKIIINIALTGEVEKSRLVLRRGAKAGDWIFVSGALGGSLKSGRHLSFTPRIKESRYLTSHYNVHAMIDISDGLLLDMSHITERSRLGALLIESMIPCYKGATINQALSDGEDFELLFTLSPKDGWRLMRERNSAVFTHIGVITEKKYGLRLLTKNNRIVKMRPAGYRHFA